jgi:hypothetical protein
MSLSIHIEHLYIGADAAGQVLAGADPDVLRDIGYTDVPDAVQPEEPMSDEEQAATYARRAEDFERRVSEEKVTLNARRNFLRNVVRHVDRARRLEGFQTNHMRRPDDQETVDTIQAESLQMASESLERACGNCAMRNNCVLAEDLDRWIDVHPYKDRTGTRRPGSLRVRKTESRTELLKALKEDPGAHCEPQKR